PALPVPKDAVPGTVSQDDRPHGLPLPFELLVKQREEKCLVLYDRSADASCELMAVNPGLFAGLRDAVDHLLVVDPSIGVERGVPNRPCAGPVQLIGARTRQDLDLSVASSHLGVNWGKDDPEFADHIRMHLSRSAHSICITSVLNAETISNGVDHARTDTGKRRGFP